MLQRESRQVVNMLAAIPFSGPLGKIAFLSLMVLIVAIPTRLSRAGVGAGPRRAVSYYLGASVGYYGLLRVVIPRLG